MGVRETVIRENAKKSEDENHSVEKLTPQGVRPACRCLEQQASSRPASRLQAPRGQAQALVQRLPPGERRG
jgi:hypothetical protein